MKTRMNIKLGQKMRKLGLQMALSTMIVSTALASQKIGEALGAPSTVNIKVLAYGHILARSLHAVAYFKIADELVKGPKSAEELGIKLNLKTVPLKRILRVLANHKILEMTAEGIFSLPAESKILVSTEIGSIQPALAKEFDARRWESMGHLEIPLRTGNNPFQMLYGESFYDYLERDQEAAELFNKGMKNFSDQEDSEIAPLLPLQAGDIHCDVGGGSGGLMSQILNVHLLLGKGILMDLQDAVQKANAIYKDPFKGRFVGISGDFFEGIPQAHTYSIKRVLHNWGDEQCIKILKNCLNSMINPQRGRIYVIEKVLPQKPDGSLLVDTDLIGLTLGEGIERTLDEFIEILKKAGFAFEGGTKCNSGVSILTFKVTP